MSVLSFRERAAIAYGTTTLYERSGGPTCGAPRAETVVIDRETLDPDSAVVHAQRLADACCKAWGHDEWSGHCRRCGAELST